jgi:hypothetical protein
VDIVQIGTRFVDNKLTSYCPFEKIIKCLVYTNEMAS